MKNSKPIRFIKDIYAGRTVYRFLFESSIEAHLGSLTGSVLDIGGNRNSGYYRLFSKDAKVTASNYFLKDGVDTVVDASKKLAFADGTFDAVVCFNMLYVLADQESALREFRRVLKPAARFLISMPFIANEMPEPADYSRLTYQGLQYQLGRAGFSDILVSRFGERVTSAAYLLHSVYFFNTVRLVVYSLALLGDKLLPRSIKRNHPTPLGYVASASK